MKLKLFVFLFAIFIGSAAAAETCIDDEKGATFCYPFDCEKIESFSKNGSVNFKRHLWETEQYSKFEDVSANCVYRLAGKDDGLLGDWVSSSYDCVQTSVLVVYENATYTRENKIWNRYPMVVTREVATFPKPDHGFPNISIDEFVGKHDDWRGRDKVGNAYQFKSGQLLGVWPDVTNTSLYGIRDMLKLPADGPYVEIFFANCEETATTFR